MWILAALLLIIFAVQTHASGSIVLGAIILLIIGRIIIAPILWLLRS